MLDSLLEGPLDLSISTITEPGPGLLIATSRMTTARGAVAAVAGLVCVGLGAYVWRHRADWVEFVWPHGAIIPVFGAIAIVLGFGHDRRAFDAAAKTARSTARLGPFSVDKTYALPAGAAVKITVRKEYPSRAGGKGSVIPVRWYDVKIPGVPAADFTVASDREAARAFAKTLAASLNCAVVDEAEDDGVERIPPR